ncbi:aminobenzoate synthetase [Sphingomonas sp. Leaf412]|uniref:aminodeoxychorismate synthase component I n=1 Tax=Sphingomonas sp. Leaf412 TaxID=1736370 RepID=UPI0006FDF6C8|nr:aminodeoxychorismate synthase component I [Sphingomonas sp. Leaf412]KQT34918.1 aminobenzoate synthetase [Sphingomonas sp. Leaf412]
MLPDPPFVLLDDARDGGAGARLYARPERVLVAWTPDEVRDVLADVRGCGRDVAGFLSYEAAGAFEPRAMLPGRVTPLAWLGVFDGWETVDVPALLPDAAGGWAGAPEPLVTRADYDDMFARVQALIAAGDLYQANLTFRARVRIAGDPLALYASLRAATRAGWGAVVATGDDLLLSLSPELFFSVAGDTLTCRPMKGTARRLPDAAADAAVARGLAEDEKQRAENLMVVDLMRNDLSRVAVAGSVAVPDLFAVESYPTVHQMTSTVTATRAPGRDAVDVLGALFPCGSITGAPKLRAIAALQGIEADARGPYTGSIGRIDREGDAMFNVAIRTLLIRDDTATMGLGGGIVADSTAAAEWDEALAKGGFVTHAQRPLDLIETMAFDPMEGMLLLDRHMARMKASATALGFAFDRHGARNELQAATFRLRGPAKVRVMLARSGTIAIEVAPLPARRDAPLAVVVAPLPVPPHDLRLRHKTSDRGFYDAARGQADEAVFVRADGQVTEGSFTNLFVARDGLLVTPPADLGLLPGVLRGELLDTGRAVEGSVTVDDLRDGFFLGNALRGLMPAKLAVA